MRQVGAAALGVHRQLGRDEVEIAAAGMPRLEPLREADPIERNAQLLVDVLVVALLLDDDHVSLAVRSLLFRLDVAAQQIGVELELAGHRLQQFLLDLLGGHQLVVARAVPLVELAAILAPFVRLPVPHAFLLPRLVGVHAVVAGIGLETLGEMAQHVLGVLDRLVILAHRPRHALADLDQDITIRLGVVQRLDRGLAQARSADSPGNG